MLKIANYEINILSIPFVYLSIIHVRLCNFQEEFFNFQKSGFLNILQFYADLKKSKTASALVTSEMFWCIIVVAYVD